MNIKRINKNTLINISQFSNKLLRISKYLKESNQILLLDKCMMINDKNDHKELLEAFDFDLNKTVNLYYDIQKLIITADKDGVVNELKNDIKNLSDIFGESYDNERRNLKISEKLSLRLDDPSDKNIIKEKLIREVLKMSVDEYKHIQKAKNTIKSTDKRAIANLNDGINYLVSSADIDLIKYLVEDINNLVDTNIEYRNGLEDEDKNIIDTKIVSDRTMIDGVVQDSTFFRAKKLIQSSAKHNNKDLDEVLKILKGIDCIANLEIDKDVDILKVIDVLKKIKDLHVNTDNQFDFKIRKLGNYNVNGMFIRGYNIVTVDVNSPSSLLHEIVHYVDLTNNELLYSQQRKDIVEKFKERMFEACGGEDAFEEYEESRFKKGYLSSSVEVIARLGELSGILNLYDYDGEDIEQFIKKVKVIEKFKMSSADEKDILLVKYINVYASERNIDFFNFSEMSKDDLLEIKDYFKTYFNLKNGIFKDINDIKINSGIYNIDGKPIEKIERERKSFDQDKKPVSKINVNNIEQIYIKNKKDKIIDEVKFARHITAERINLARTTLSMPDLMTKSSSTFDLFTSLVNEKGNIEEKKGIINILSFANSASNPSLNEKAVNNSLINLIPNSNNDSIHEFNYSVNKSLIPWEGYTYKSANGKRSHSVRFNIPILEKLGFNSNDNFNSTFKRDKPIEYIDLLNIEDLRTLESRVDKRIKNLLNFNKSDEALHMSIFEMSNIFKELNSFLNCERNLKKINIAFDEQINFKDKDIFLNGLNELINKEVKILLDNDLSDDRYSFDRRYGTPKFKIKLNDIKEEYLIKILDEVIEQIESVPPAVEKSAMYKKFKEGENLNIDKKIKIISKLLLSNLNTEYAKSLLSKLTINEMTNEKCSKLINFEGSTKGKNRTENTFNLKINEYVSNFIKNENITINQYNSNDSQKILTNIAFKYISNYHLNKEMDSFKAGHNEFLEIEKSKNENLLKTFEKIKESASIYEPVLFSINNKIVRFLNEKDVLKTYLDFIKSDKKLYNNFRDEYVKEFKESVSKILNLHGNDLNSENALSEITKIYGINLNTESKKLDFKI